MPGPSDHRKSFAGGAFLKRGEPKARLSLRPLLLANFTSALDRFSIAPMLVVIARDLHVSLGTASAAASVYFLCYGASQLGWGAVTDRIGRVRTIRLTLGLGALACLASAVVPSFALLAVARGLAGISFGAVTPAALVYVGDSLPVEERHGPLSQLVVANAAGTAVAIAGAGVAASLGWWRLAFAAPAMLAAALTIVLARLPEPPKQGLRRGPVRQFMLVARRPWAILVIGLGFGEGAVVLGCLTYLAPALETQGIRAAIAGAVVAVFGLGVIALSAAPRLIRGRPQTWLLGVGGAGYTLAYLCVSLTRGVPAVLACAVLLGLGWALMHPILQSWATDVAPDARASTVSLFATALFLGSAFAAAVGGPLAERNRFGTLFIGAALVAAVLTSAAVAGRSRYAAERYTVRADRSITDGEAQ